jgi:hypothetical protein
VTVIVNVPVGVDETVVTVSVELAPVAGFGLNDAAAPAGRPLALKVTPAVKLVLVMLIV